MQKQKIMAWNHSRENRDAQQSSVGARHSFVLKGVLAGGVTMLIAGLVVWLMLGRGNSKIAIKEHGISKSLIPASTNVVIRSQTNAVPVAEKRKLRTYVDEKGVERYEGGLRVVKHWPKPPKESINYDKRLFKHAAENQIHALLSIQPGTTVLGLKYNPRAFEKSLRESLKSTIEILPDDSEVVKIEKNAVIEAKKTMAEALERGEDVTRLLDETRQELIRLQRYRDQLQGAAVEQLAKDGTSDKEIDDYLDAMNKMLTENGIKPIRQKELTHNILKHQRKTEKLKAQASKEKEKVK